MICTLSIIPCTIGKYTKVTNRSLTAILIGEYMRCPTCGAELQEGSAFCHICGTPITQQTQPTEDIGKHIGDTSELPVVPPKEPSALERFRRRLHQRRQNRLHEKENRRLKRESLTPEERYERKKRLLVRIVAVLSAIFAILLIYLVSIHLVNRGKTPISTKTFPDAGFMNYVRAFDSDNDGYLSEEELAAVTSIDCPQLALTNLTGIGHFTNLTELDCAHNKIVSLDLSSNTQLATLDCSDNKLVTLDVSPLVNLTSLSCANDELKTLTLGQLPLLASLDCSSNALTAIDLTGLSHLTTLACDKNELESLDVTKNGALEKLSCLENKIKKLDLSDNPKLTQALYDEGVDLVVALNEKTVPDQALREALKSFDDGDGKLTREERDAVVDLDLSEKPVADLTGLGYFTHLASLTMSDSPATSLALGEMPALTKLSITNSALASIDLSGAPALTTLVLKNDKLTALDLDANTKLASLDIRGNAIGELNVRKLDSLSELYLDPSVSVKGAVTKTTADFPDEALRDYLFSEKINANGDDMLVSSERDNLTALSLDGTKIKDLTGLSGFKKLASLNCNGVKLSRLSLEGLDGLTELKCAGCGLTTLELGGTPNLTKLDCSNNKIKKLDLRPCPKLTIVNAMNNGMETLELGKNSPLRPGAFNLFIDGSTKIERS